MLVDRKALQQRVKNYMRAKDDEELSIEHHDICDFKLLDGSKSGEEQGLQCTSHYYSYSLLKQDMHGPEIHHDDDGHRLRILAEYPFKVAGNNEPITQLFKMTVGSEFAFAAGLKVILRRVDGVLSEHDKLNPFFCLLDQSCQFAWRQ